MCNGGLSGIAWEEEKAWSEYAYIQLDIVASDMT
jgi:hypothetical protein